MELLDVIDENNNITGKVQDRKIVHEKGLWHRQVACWIMNQNGDVLYQKRASTKKVNANKWARTGGHVYAGEEPIIAIKREIKEEIGVDIPIENINLISIKKVDTFFEDENRYHRYFGYDYIVFVEYKIEDYKIQKEELSEVRYLSIEEMQKLKKENNQNYTFVKWNNFDEIISMLKTKRDILLTEK